MVHVNVPLTHLLYFIRNRSAESMNCCFEDGTIIIRQITANAESFDIAEAEKIGVPKFPPRSWHNSAYT